LAECAEEAKLDTPEKRQKARELFEKLGLEPPASLWE
jgi:heterodisulfide reductase subunit B